MNDQTKKQFIKTVNEILATAILANDEFDHKPVYSNIYWTDSSKSNLVMIFGQSSEEHMIYFGYVSPDPIGLFSWDIGDRHSIEKKRSFLIPHRENGPAFFDVLINPAFYLEGKRVKEEQLILYKNKKKLKKKINNL